MSDQRSYARHILLPYNVGDQHILRDLKSLETLRQIFPGTTEVIEGPSHFGFVVDKLPMRPWPVTIGGRPFTISDGTQGRSSLFPRQVLGNLQISICQEIDGSAGLSHADLQLVARGVLADLRSRLQPFRVVEIIYTSARTLSIVVADNVDIGKIIDRLPGRIAKCSAGYLNHKELNRPWWCDFPWERDIDEPQPTIGPVDDAAYDMLRPGVMISSIEDQDHSAPVVLNTTAGVLVQDASGAKFMTAATHGIGKDESVFQLQADGQKRTLGTAVHRIGFTDVAMIQLNDRISFVNEGFENRLGFAPRLLGEVPGEKVRFNTITSLNSPFTGNREGVVVAISVKLKKTAFNPHPSQANIKHIMYTWTYGGQVEDATLNDQGLPQGACGSPIWDNNNVILGFLHHYIDKGQWAGFCVNVSAEEVVNAGFQLA